MITNAEAARRLGCDISTVSRLRSGDRTPSVDLLMNIESTLDWSGQKQVDALRGGTYATEFDALLESTE